MSIQVIVNQAGPLPVVVTFDAPGDEPMYLEVNGSVYSGTANEMIGINVVLDTKWIGHAQIFSNGAETHRAVVPGYFLVQLSEGQHQLSLSPATGFTTSDSNDFYTVVLHY